MLGRGETQLLLPPKTDRCEKSFGLTGRDVLVLNWQDEWRRGVWPLPSGQSSGHAVLLWPEIPVRRTELEVKPEDHSRWGEVSLQGSSH